MIIFIILVRLVVKPVLDLKVVDCITKLKSVSLAWNQDVVSLLGHLVVVVVFILGVII